MVLHNVTDVIVVQADGTQTALGLGGYLDIGLLDTMEDLFVNFIGALAFSIIGYFYVRSRSGSEIASGSSRWPKTACRMYRKWQRQIPAEKRRYDRIKKPPACSS